MWSSGTANFYAGSEIPSGDFVQQAQQAQGIGNFTGSFWGLYEAIVRSQVPFDVVDEIRLEAEDLSEQYDLLLLPNCACLSPETCEYIRTFVQNGGHLIATFETSLYNAFGEKQSDFGLSDVFGVHFDGHLLGPYPYDYVAPPQEHPLLQDLTKRWFPAPGYGIQTLPSGGEPILLFCEKLVSSYERLPVLSDHPAAVLNRYGKGACLYLAGTFGETYGTYHFPEYKTLIRNALYTFGRPLIRLYNAPDSVEVTVRRTREGDLVVHLVNFTGTMTRPIEEIIPCRDLQVEVLGISDPRDIYALNANIPVSWSRIREDAIQCTVPEVREYEALRIAL